MGKAYEWLKHQTTKWQVVLTFIVGIAALTYYALQITNALDRSTESVQRAATVATQGANVLANKEDTIRESQEQQHRWLKDTLKSFGGDIQSLKHDVAGIKRQQDTMMRILVGAQSYGAVNFAAPHPSTFIQSYQ